MLLSVQVSEKNIYILYIDNKTKNSVFFESELNDEDDFSVILKSFLKDKKIRRARVILVLKTWRCIFRFATFNNIGVKYLSSVVKENAVKYFPISLDDYTLDYLMTNETDTTKTLLMVAVSNMELDKYIKSILELKLSIERVTIFQEALINILSSSGEGTILICTEILEKLNILVLKNGRLIDTKDLYMCEGPQMLVDIRVYLSAEIDMEINTVYITGSNLAYLKEYFENFSIEVLCYDESSLTEILLKNIIE